LSRFIHEPWVGLGDLEQFLGLQPEITRDNFFFNQTKVTKQYTYRES
jgi:hypothetical protein